MHSTTTEKIRVSADSPLPLKKCWSVGPHILVVIADVNELHDQSKRNGTGTNDNDGATADAYTKEELENRSQSLGHQHRRSSI